MNAKQLQWIPVHGVTVRPGAIKPRIAFTVGHEDGYRDAVNNAPCDPAACFARCRSALPVTDFSDYEAAYKASYAQVTAEVQS